MLRIAVRIKRVGGKLKEHFQGTLFLSSSRKQVMFSNEKPVLINSFYRWIFQRLLLCHTKSPLASDMLFLLGLSYLI